MRFIPLAMVGLLVATAAAAQTPPPPRPPDGPVAQPGTVPPPPPPRDGPDAPFPPPGGPRGARGDRPPPPPPGASLHIEKGVDGQVRVDVRCAERDSTKDCADIATRLLDHLGDAARSK